MKTARTTRDQIAVGTEHLKSDEWKEKGWVARAKLRLDLALMRRDAGGEWQKVVVDVKVTSTEDKMKEAFKEKDDKYRDWTTKETRERRRL